MDFMSGLVNMSMNEAIRCAVLICLITMTFIVFPRLHYLLHTRGKNVPPGSMGYMPLLGETLSFLKPHPSTSTGTFIQNRCKQFGRIFTSHLFGKPTVVSCDPLLNAFVLQNEDKLFQSSYPKAIHGVLGEKSMLLVVGDAHKRIRSLGLNMISTAKTSTTFLNDIERNALRVLDRWNHVKLFQFCVEAKKFTFNVIVKQILSLNPGSAQTSQIFNDFNNFMKGLVSLPINIIGTPYGKAVESRLRIFSVVETIMEERRKRGIERGDFLDSLLSNNSLSDEEIQSLVLDLLLAGYETTSTLIALVFKFLNDCPRALKEFRSEHKSIRRAKRRGGYLNWEDYTKMNFTQNVISEALRLGNIVKFVHRKALKDIRFEGYDIPEGWKVLPVLSAVHLDTSNYEDPHQFNPWRWQEPISGRKFVPFGGGLRLCPGSELARIETAVFFHHLVTSFRWKMLEEDQSMAYPYVDFEKGLPIVVDQF